MGRCYTVAALINTLAAALETDAANGNQQE
jgi:hypothetical protein